MRERNAQGKNEVWKNNIPYIITHDYCIIVYGIKLRDIRGSDLTYLDFIRTEYPEEYLNTLGFALEFLTNFLVWDLDKYANPLTLITPRQLSYILGIYLEKIYKNPMDRDTWINNVYYLNNQSFAGIDKYEDIPMTEFNYMVDVYRENVKRQEEAYKSVGQG